MCAGVTVAATGEKDVGFESGVARYIGVANGAGDIVVGLGTTKAGNGLVTTRSAKRRELVRLGATDAGHGTINTYQPNGKTLVELGVTDTGGAIMVYNKTGEGIVQVAADEYGNGLVGAYNRKGRGRTLKPGP